MAVILTPVANQEMLDASAYYESQAVGLGTRFLAEVGKAANRIEQLPEAWPMVSSRSRRVLLDVFPYALIYQLFGNDSYIIAVAHLKRREGYWRRREMK
jgi:hypothetical protein